MDSSNISPSPSLVWTEQTWLLQLLLMLCFSSSLVRLVTSALLALVFQWLSFLCRGTQNRAPCSRNSLTSAERRGGIISLVLQAMPLRMQPSVRLPVQPCMQLAASAAGDTAHSCSARCPPGPQLLFQQSCLLSCWPPARTGMWVYCVSAAELLGDLVLIPVTLYPLLWTN